MPAEKRNEPDDQSYNGDRFAEKLEAVDEDQYLDQRDAPEAGVERDSLAETLAQGSTADTPAKPPDRVSRLTRIDNYEIIEEIARGGMGIVFRARHEKLNRIVALKMMLAGPFAKEEERQRFRVEAEAAAQLDHPGIVPVFDVSEYQNQPYFTMGFVDGESLAEQIQREPLEPRQAAELASQISDAVAYAHDQGVVHRDIKPLNVLIDQAGQPRITDFGLARRSDDLSDLTGTGQILGTPTYMAPEQAAGAPGGVTSHADIYSIGATLYCMLIGRPPFQAANPIDTLRLVIDSEPLSPRQLNPNIPIDLATICLKCLHKDPHRRYENAADLAADLRSYINGEPIRARAVSRPERIAKWSRRHPLVAGLSAAITIALIAILVGGIWYQSQLTRVVAELRQSQSHGVDLLYESLTSEAEFLNKVRPVGYGARVWKNVDQARQLTTEELDKRQLLQLALNALGHPAASEPVVYESLGGKVLGADTTTDGRFLIAGLGNGQIVILDRENGTEHQRINAGSEPIMRIRMLAPDRFMSHAAFGRALTFFKRTADGQWAAEQRHDLINTDDLYDVLPSTDGRFVVGWTPMSPENVTLATWNGTLNVPDKIIAETPAKPHFFVRQIDQTSQSQPQNNPQALVLGDVPFTNMLALSDRYLVTAYTIQSPWTTKLIIANLITGDVEREIQTDCGSLGAVGITNNARYVACSGHLGLQIFDRQSGAEIAHVQDEGTCGLISMVGENGDVYFSNGSSELIWYSPAVNRAVARFDFQMSEGVPRFSTDHKQLIWSGTNDARIATIHASERRQIAAHAKRTKYVCFSPDGQMIATGGDEQWVRLWDRESGELLYQLPGHGVTLDPLGRLLVTIDGNVLKFWNIADTTPAGELDLGDYDAEFQFNANGSLLATTSGSQLDLSVYPVNLSGDAGRWTASRPVLKLNGRIGQLVWSPAGNRLVYVRLDGGQWHIHLHDFDTPASSFVVKESPLVTLESISFVGHDRLAIITEERIEMWDLNTRQRVAIGSTVARFPIGCSPNKRFLVSRNHILPVDRLDDATQLPLWGKVAWSVAWSPDGRTLALGTDGGKLDIWDLEAVDQRLATLGLRFPANEFTNVPPLESVSSLIQLCRQSQASVDPMDWQQRCDKALSLAQGEDPLPNTFPSQTLWLVNHFAQQPIRLFQPPSKPMHAERMTQLVHLSRAIKQTGSHELAEDLLLRILSAAGSLQSPTVDLRAGLAFTQHELGDLYSFQMTDKLPEALTAYRAEQTLYEQLRNGSESPLPIDSERLFWMNHNCALALAKTGDRAAAIELMQRALSITRSDPKIAPQQNRQTSYRRLINWLKAENRLEEADAMDELLNRTVLEGPPSTPD